MTKKNCYNIVKLVSLKMVQEESYRNYGNISSQHDVVNLMKKYIANEYRETAFVIGMNTRNKTVLIHRLGIGSIDRCVLPVASVIKPLLLSNCSTAIIIHNHPSDSMNPSEADIKITQKVKDALKLVEMELLDHIIVNSDCSESFSMRSSHHW